MPKAKHIIREEESDDEETTAPVGADENDPNVVNSPAAENRHIGNDGVSFEDTVDPNDDNSEPYDGVEEERVLKELSGDASAGYDQFADILKQRKRIRKTVKKTDEDGNLISRSVLRQRQSELNEEAGSQRSAEARVLVDMNADNSFTLYRNLKQTMDTDVGTGGKAFKNWTDTYITPVEQSCMVKQMTQCTDFKRLSVLMEMINEDMKHDENGVQAVGKSALKTHPHFYEVVSLLKAERQNYHSQVGSIGAALHHLKIKAKDGVEDETMQVEEKKLKDGLESVNQKYSANISRIYEWVQNSTVADAIFTHDSLSDRVKEHLADNFAQHEIEQKSLELRKRVMRDIFVKITNLTRDNLNDFSKGIYGNVVFANYSKGPGDKKQRTLELQNSMITNAMLYEALFSKIAVKKMIKVLSESRNEQVKAAISQPDTTLINTELYRSRLGDINGMFRKVHRSDAWQEMFKMIMWSGVIPHPVAQSTYKVHVSNLGDDQIANMMMWPDRLAYCYNPHVESLDIDANSVKFVIYSDHLDPGFSIWNYSKTNKRSGLSSASLEAMTVKAVFLHRQVRTALSSMETSEFDTVLSPQSALRFSEADKAMITDCGRSPNLQFMPVEGTNPQYDGIRAVFGSNQMIWNREVEYRKLAVIRYLNRVQRASTLSPDEYENGLAYGRRSALESIDEYVSDGSSQAYTDDDTGVLEMFGNVVDSKNNGELKRGPSEYTIYLSSPPQTDQSQETTAGTLDSMVSYKMNTYPENAPEVGILAGSVVTVELHERKDRNRKNIWYKDRFLMRKKEKSNKQEKELHKFVGSFSDTVDISVIARDSRSGDAGSGSHYPDDMPAWVLLVFKMISSVIYILGEGRAMGKMIMVDLNTLKLFGIEENIAVFILRRFFDFGLCVPTWAQSHEGSDPYYRNADGSGWYDYDYVYKNYSKHYKTLDAAGMSEVFNVTPDVPGPILLRPCPSNSELFGMFQFTMSRLFVNEYGSELHQNLFSFLYSYEDMKSGNMKETNKPVTVGELDGDRGRIPATPYDPSDVLRTEDSASDGFIYSGEGSVSVFTEFCRNGIRDNDEQLSLLERYLCRCLTMGGEVYTAVAKEAPRSVNTKSMFNDKNFPRTGGIPRKLWRKMRMTLKQEIRELVRRSASRKAVRDLIDPLLAEMNIDKSDPHVRKINEKLLAEKDDDLANSFYPDAVSRFAVDAMTKSSELRVSGGNASFPVLRTSSRVNPTVHKVSRIRSEIVFSADSLLTEVRSKLFDEVRAASFRLETKSRAVLLPEEVNLLSFPPSEQFRKAGEAAKRWSDLKQSARVYKVMMANLFLMCCFWAKHVHSEAGHVLSNLAVPEVHLNDYKMYFDHWAHFCTDVSRFLYSDEGAQYMSTFMVQADVGGSASGDVEADDTANGEYDNTVEFEEVDSTLLSETERDFVGMESSDENRAVQIDATDERIYYKLHEQLSLISTGEKFSFLEEFPEVTLYVKEESEMNLNATVEMEDEVQGD